MKTVFIFGAGASRDSGGPLMHDFLDRAATLQRQAIPGIQGAREDFDNVFSAIKAMQAIHAKSYLNLEDIEVLFGAIEMALIIGKLSNWSKQQIQELRNSIITLIVKTLEHSIRFPLQGNILVPPQPYADFMKILSEIIEKQPTIEPHDFSFLTFNYDLTLDVALYRAGLKYDYFLDDNITSQVPYLKLHGSINWGFCPRCKKIAPVHIKEMRLNPFPRNKFVYLNVGSTLQQYKHLCGSNISGPPMIVPPTWGKTEHMESLSKVWAQAAKELAQAENIFIIGYSLPDTDLFFRYLFALGTEGPTSIRRLWVINPDDSGDVEKRFRDFIGRGIERRFEYIPSTFQGSLLQIQKALNEP